MILRSFFSSKNNELMILELLFYHQRYKILSHLLASVVSTTSSVIIFRVEALNGMGFACPRARSTSERDLSSADQRQYASILPLMQGRVQGRSLPEHLDGTHRRQCQSNQIHPTLQRGVQLKRGTNIERVGV